MRKNSFFFLSWNYDEFTLSCWGYTAFESHFVFFFPQNNPGFVVIDQWHWIGAFNLINWYPLRFRDTFVFYQTFYLTFWVPSDQIEDAFNKFWAICSNGSFLITLTTHLFNGHILFILCYIFGIRFSFVVIMVRCKWWLLFRLKGRLIACLWFENEIRKQKNKNWVLIKCSFVSLVKNTNFWGKICWYEFVSILV